MSLVWVYFFVPETRKVALEDMDRVFGDFEGEQETLRRRQLLRRLGFGETS